ncbi:signal recognition particle protein [Kytococcus sedentarius]|uniref:Signal recognition particle protein n=1 Tax=Kytococcus sedentarius (strain ATCC 14392 / DSM 20547 / JCM 11482 / CCUG 33030 / NBRC 15357 / NCTC 11040 / CCM 314 / 541) TaxID=478801 RepID=C7NGN0_KYTSD|nr:signal recognition particle protein [Kytococcus sedentarius]ACV06138.1 signal recognition particle subunit FFH/SRP54 (srp54) [Kytococcus sedentarius DSM 20547]STX12441.1 Fifty-four homolog [Kytococcus sedentarius]
MFNSLSDRLTLTFGNLKRKGKLTESDVNATVRDIRLALLDADVALPVVKQFTSVVRERATGAEVSQALNPAQQVVKIVNEELVDILGGETRTIRFAKRPPTVIMLAGLQGAGKTTLAGKLGHWLKQQGHTPLLVACDLQRPNAVNQLQVVGERAGVPVYAPEKGNVFGHDAALDTGEGTRSFGDPVEVARRGVAQGQARQHDVVIIDTAGRLAVDENLMQQAADIRAAVNPEEVLFVIDAMIGQAAIDTAMAFDEGVNFTGVVLSKLDGDARGGAALSVASVTGKPVMFASTGEQVKDFEVFHPDRMASRILDMGDVLTLIEQAEQAFDRSQAAEMSRKFMSDEDFTFDDFLEQMSAIKKMGNLKQLLGMMPGMGQMRAQIEALDEKEFDRVEAMVRSMTPFERNHPKQINGSRRARIAKGAGTTVSEVNQLLERFGAAQKMMKQFKKGGGMPGMPPGMAGMPGMPGPGGAGGAKGKKGKNQRSKAKSGNPAKRAQQEAAEARKAEEAQQRRLDEMFGGGEEPQAPKKKSAFGGLDALAGGHGGGQGSSGGDAGAGGHGLPGGGHPGAKGSGAGAKDADDQGLGDLQLPKGFEKFLGGGGHGKG